MGYYGNQPAIGENNSFRILDDIKSHTLTFDGSSVGLVSITDSTITAHGHRFVTGQRVTYNDGGGTAIGGLSDGVYYVSKVDKDTFKLSNTYAQSIAGTNITFGGLGVGSSHTINVAFDGVNTRFSGTYSSGKRIEASRAAQVTISINGVIQQPVNSKNPASGFGIDSDGVIVFSEAPIISDIFWGYSASNNFATFDISDNDIDTFTANGSDTDFSLSKIPVNNENVLVTIDGVVQHPSDNTSIRAYSVSGNVISFTAIPAVSSSIQVRHIGFAGATGGGGGGGVTGFYGRTGNVSLQGTDTVDVGTINATSVTGTALTFTTGTISGNLTIGGVLTYDDVTSVDSVGIITARDTIDAQGNVTVGAGLSVVGVSTFSEDIIIGTGATVGFGSTAFFGDNVKATFGDSSDLEIYHNGSNSYVKDAGTGALYLLSGNTTIKNATESKTAAVFNTANSVDLYYNNSKKFETTSSGAKVSGTVGLATALVVEGDLRVTGVITTGTGSITFDGPNNNIIVGSGVTIYGNTGIISATSGFRGKLLGVPEIGAIDSTISDTAVDIFVYDTSKDSDGGAWRKRTQNTSWYNETLGTATRGSRKEFPAVAVIVAETTKVTIYDGDDPDLPMWMVFNLLGSVGSSCNMLSRGGSGQESDITSVAFLNSKLVVGLRDTSGTVGEGLVEVNFISDFGRVYREVGSGYTGAIYNLPISGRNSNSSYSGDYDSLGIIVQTINDVAMTVLPNAPVDSATGLPVPTIAVGTDSGLSVIADDGSVYDVSGFSPVQQTGFSDDKLFIHTMNGTITYAAIGRRKLTADIGLNDWEFGDQFNTGASDERYLPASHTKAIVTSSNELVFGGSSTGLFKIQTDDQVEVNGDASNEKCEITTSYNTGWMHGDIKGAFLSGISTASVTSSNLISGATYSSSDRITSYSYTNGSSTLVITDNPATADGYVTLTLGGLTPLTTYVLTVTANQTYTPTTGYNCHLGNTADSTVYFEDNFTGTASQNITFKTATSGDPTLVLYSNYNGALTYTLDLRLAEFDRSVGSFSAWDAGQTATIGQKRGLAVYGTITKSAVATGADLVAYSGFSASNYLEQPYNSSLGLSSTDSVTIICWIKQASHNNSNQVIFGTGQMAIGQGRYIYTNSGRPYLDTYGGAVSNSTTVITDDTWHHLVAIYTPSGGFMYIDGTLDATPTYGSSGYVSPSGSPRLGTRIGCERTGASPTPAYVSLLRISNSVPSAEQIKKIYDDERWLFQENAKCTLYGSSDAVTALAYDEVTDQLHVGTSSGRSDFQGLRRINNTTTAVTTAISAHDEFIIEQ